jgi:hypothetical protein
VRAIVIVMALAGVARAEPAVDAVWLSLPSIDGATGAELGAEHFVPERRLGLVVTAGARKSAAGDYSAIAGGVGVEARWYWHGRALWTDAQGPVGWFVGGRGDLALSRTRDNADDRSLGTTLVLGAQGLFGYRLAPWRGVEVTPSVGLGVRNEHDLRGRLPPWTLGSFTVGLELGWLF